MCHMPQRAIRTERYKLVWNAEVGIMNIPEDIMHSPIFPQMMDQVTFERPPLELYDLQTDPLEQENLILDPAFQPTVRQLCQELVKWMQETDDPLLNCAVSSPFYHYGLGLIMKG